MNLKDCFTLLALGYKIPLSYLAGMSDLGLKRARLAPNETNPVLFKISFQYILVNIDLKMSQICPIYCQSGSFWA